MCVLISRCRYSANTSEEFFVLNLSVDLCIDNFCDAITILGDQIVPIPLCNPNGTLTLPGDGTILGYVESLYSEADEAAVDIVLSALGIKVWFTR